MKSRLVIFLIAVIFSIGFIKESFANSAAETYGFSAHGISRGNAMTAVVNDWSSVFYNVAGLGKTPKLSKEKVVTTTETTKSKKKSILEKEEEETTEVVISDDTYDELNFGYIYGMPQLKIDTPIGTKMDKNLDSGAICIGFVLDINHIINFKELVKFISPKVYNQFNGVISSARFGLGLQLPGDGKIAKVNDIDVKEYDFMRYGRETERVVILAGMGFGLWDDVVSGGVGTNILITGAGAVRMTDVGVYSEQTPDYEAKMDMQPLISPVIGVAGKPGELLHKLLNKESKFLDLMKGIEVGAAYRGEVSLDLSPFKADAEVATLPITLGMTIGLLDFYTPEVFVIGGGYTLPIFKEITVTGTCDLEYQRWSKFTIGKAREDYYERKGYTPPEFQDIIVPKLGLSVKLFSWLTGNAGYFYQQSFIPEDATTDIWNFLDNDKHVFSCGTQFVIPANKVIVAPVYINLAFQYQLLVPREVTKNRVYNSQVDSYASNHDPVIADEHSQEAIDGYWNNHNPNYSYGGAVYALALDCTIKF